MASSLWNLVYYILYLYQRSGAQTPFAMPSLELVTIFGIQACLLAFSTLPPSALPC